ncbi:energy transducer TonB [Odoribacter lunatus]|uniref:energy transducer TonB n=1 Tax=Odoribacter lunatus TaxID=2941335 RepID=UPI002040E58A|nr:energy transducer TonB [Odoribacter lunatus]
MEIKKAPKVDLEGKKGIFFEIGLLLALGILLYAFEWKTETKKTQDMQGGEVEQVEEEIIPVTTQNTPPPPPPPPAPKLTDLINIVENDQDIDEDLEITDAEDETENTVVDVTQFNELEEEDTGEAEIFRVVEEQPGFNGNMNKWLKDNLKYPVIAQENGVSGKVYVEFVVEKDGSITDVKVVRSVDPSLDKEAVRVVKSMPKWKPGKQRGKPVRVAYTIPINFTLSN